MHSDIRDNRSENRVHASDTRTSAKPRFRYFALLTILILTVFVLAGCNIKMDSTGAAVTEKDAEELRAEKNADEENADEDPGLEDGSDPDEDEAEEAEERADIVKTIDGIDDDLGPRLPLQISQIILYEDGSVEIIPTDDLRKNEIGDGTEEGIYPFEESGKVTGIWLLDYGNGGYRTVAALIDDGTISCVNGRALVEDHVVAVMDNVGGRDTFVSIENQSDESGSVIIGITEKGEEVILDYSLNF